MLFLKKIVALPTNEKSPCKGNNHVGITMFHIQTLVEEIEKGLEEKATPTVPANGNLFKIAKKHPFFQKGPNCTLINSIESAQARKDTVLHFFKHLLYLTCKKTDDEEKKNEFRIIANYCCPKTKEHIGLVGINLFLYTHMANPPQEKEEFQKKLNAFKEYVEKDPQNRKWIIGIFGSDPLCTVRVDGIQKFSGVILKQDSSIDQESSDKLYLFDEELRDYIKKGEEPIASTTPTCDSCIVDLDTLRTLCHEFKGTTRTITARVEADFIRTPVTEGIMSQILTSTRRRPDIGGSKPGLEVEELLFSKNGHSIFPERRGLLEPPYTAYTAANYRGGVDESPIPSITSNPLLVANPLSRGLDFNQSPDQSPDQPLNRTLRFNA